MFKIGNSTNLNFKVAKSVSNRWKICGNRRPGTAITCSSHGRRMANSSGPPCCPTPPYPGCPNPCYPPTTAKLSKSRLSNSTASRLFHTRANCEDGCPPSSHCKFWIHSYYLSFTVLLCDCMSCTQGEWGLCECNEGYHRSWGECHQVSHTGAKKSSLWRVLLFSKVQNNFLQHKYHIHHPSHFVFTEKIPTWTRSKQKLQRDLQNITRLLGDRYEPGLQV